jgi:hypothetical protein
MRGTMTAVATVAVAALLAVPAAGAAPEATQSSVSAGPRVYRLTWTLRPCLAADRFEIYAATHEWTLKCQGDGEPLPESVHGTYTQSGSYTKFSSGGSIMSFNFEFWGVGNPLDTRYVGGFLIIGPELVQIVPGLFVLTEI